MRLTDCCFLCSAPQVNLLRAGMMAYSFLPLRTVSLAQDRYLVNVSWMNEWMNKVFSRGNLKSWESAMEGRVIHNTCFNPWSIVESLLYTAVLTERKMSREVGIDISASASSWAAPMLVTSMNSAGDEEHQPVWPGQIHKLVSPSIHY